MNITDRLTKIAKELQSSMFTKDQALRSMKATNKWNLLSSKLTVERDDNLKIFDINEKGYGNDDKKFKLIIQLALSIKDPAKAYRLGVAALEGIDLKNAQKQSAASVFFERAIDLL